MNKSPDMLIVFWGKLKSQSLTPCHKLSMRHDFGATPKKKNSNSFLSACYELPALRAEIQQQYIDITASIGLAERDSETLRNYLSLNGTGVSRWWYHLLSCRNDPVDQSFQDFLDVVLIDNIALRLGVTRLELHGATKEVVNILSSKWALKSYDEVRGRPLFLKTVGLGLASRLKYFANFVFHSFALKNFGRTGQDTADAVFLGFYDWSVKATTCNNIVDKYFGKVPELLKRNGIRIKHVAWFDPYAENKKRAESLKQILAPVEQNKDLMFLQKFLTVRDVVSEILNFKILAGLILFHPSIKSKITFRNMNFYPAFRNTLILRSLDSSIPHLKLVELSVKRVFEHYQAKLGVMFLETYPYSRALVGGIKASNCGKTVVACQHSPKSVESLFFRHSKLDVNSSFDGHKVPLADYFCAIGWSGEALAKASCFDEKKVHVTGSPRFDGFDKKFSRSKNKNEDNLKIIFAASGDLDAECRGLEIVISAIASLRSNSRINLKIREHPFYPIKSALARKVDITPLVFSGASLQDDLLDCDLLLFSNSTVADEAIISGIPAWQIITEKLCYSSLLGVDFIPAFHSEIELRKALDNVITEGRLKGPTLEQRKLVEQHSFLKLDGKASIRVANRIIDILKS